MKVIAKELGIYGGGRRRQGEVFDLTPGDSPADWMLPVNGAPVKKPEPAPKDNTLSALNKAENPPVAGEPNTFSALNKAKATKFGT
jgi:hypothetical protein